MTAEKIMENRLRRALRRRGLRLMKSKRRDPRAIDFGGYMIVDLQTNAVVAGSGPVPFAMTLQEVEEWLKN